MWHCISLYSIGCHASDQRLINNERTRLCYNHATLGGEFKPPKPSEPGIGFGFSRRSAWNPGNACSLLHNEQERPSVGLPTLTPITLITLGTATTYMFRLQLLATRFGGEAISAGNFFKIAHQHCCSTFQKLRMGGALGMLCIHYCSQPQRLRKTSRQLPL